MRLLTSVALLGMGLPVWAQTDVTPLTVTLGFEETHYLIDPSSGAILDMKRRVKTRFFDGDRSGSGWKRGDLDFKIVGEGNHRGVAERTVVASGGGFTSKKSTFATSEAESSKAEMRASLCGLRGAPTKEILGIVTYRAHNVLSEKDHGTMKGEQWIAPALTCVVLEERIWFAKPDGQEITIKTVQPLFRKEGLPDGAFAIPEGADEVAPSKIEEAVLERILPRSAQQGAPLGVSFQRLDQRYQEGRAQSGDSRQ